MYLCVRRIDFASLHHLVFRNVPKVRHSLFVHFIYFTQTILFLSTGNMFFNVLSVYFDVLIPFVFHVHFVFCLHFSEIDSTGIHKHNNIYYIHFKKNLRTRTAYPSPAAVFIHGLFGGVLVAHLFSFSFSVLCFVCVRFVSCVHYWL
jgi:hypothetical protein